MIKIGRFIATENVCDWCQESMHTHGWLGPLQKIAQKIAHFVQLYLIHDWYNVQNWGVGGGGLSSWGG